ncbi:MAG TPA: M17 family peptidase N-terminal domain-containing protein [Streptosporangiaceae bacterium]
MISFEAVAGGPGSPGGLARLVTEVAADVLVLPWYAAADTAAAGPADQVAGAAGPPEPGPAAVEVSAALGLDLAAALARRGFSGAAGETFSTLTLGRLAAPAVLCLGLGPRAQAGPGAIRQAALLAGPVIAGYGRAAVVLPAAGSAEPARELAAALAEGLELAAYSFGRYRRAPSWRPTALAEVLVLASDGPPPGGLDAIAAGLRRGAGVARLANWVRDLVNASPADSTPELMAQQARAMAADQGLDIRVLGGQELRAGGFGGILGVGQGSRHEPRLVELSYRGGDGPVIGLTGKGITFDSGGLTLKRTAEIEWMKSDMAGAATIMAVLRGAAQAGLPVNIDAALPFAENMPGGSAQRPGDVLTHRGGVTSEIRDTDSEGRLVVADALAYLAERDPAVLIDVATLTDAAGLGPGLWAVLGTDEGLAAGLVASGLAAGDPGWALPLPPAYRRYLDSTVADIRNTPSEGEDTTVMAAMYLREFTSGVPWAHIDNGSTAFLEHQADGWPEGATGSPLRALLHWIEFLAPEWLDR